MLRLSSFPSDVLGVLLAGFSSASNTVVTSADSVLVALGKLQAQVSAGGGAGLTTASATIDLGSTPVNTAQITVTDAAIITTSNLQVYISAADSTSDNNTGDHAHAGASWQMSCVPGAGSFTLNIDAVMDLCWGTFKVRYAH